MKLALRKHYFIKLSLFNKPLDGWCLETYVRIKYLLGEPL